MLPLMQGGRADRLKAMQDVILWPPVPRVSVVVRWEGNGSEIRVRNERTAANMSDEGFEGAQLQAQPPQPKRGKIWGQEQPKTKMVHHCYWERARTMRGT